MNTFDTRVCLLKGALVFEKLTNTRQVPSVIKIVIVFVVTMDKWVNALSNPRMDGQGESHPNIHISN